MTHFRGKGRNPGNISLFLENYKTPQICSEIIWPLGTPRAYSSNMYTVKKGSYHRGRWRWNQKNLCCSWRLVERKVKVKAVEELGTLIDDFPPFVFNMVEWSLDNKKLCFLLITVMEILQSLNHKETIWSRVF